MVELDDHAVVAGGGFVERGSVHNLGGGLSGERHVIVADLHCNGAELASLGGIGVADGAVSLLHGGDHAGGALGALANLVRPVLAELIAPSVASGILDVAQEVLGGAGLVGAVHHGDVEIRQVNLRVLLLDGVIVPLGDLAVEDLGDGVGVHVQGLTLAGDTVEVEDHCDRGDVDRDVEGVAGSAHALGLLDLVIGQGGIGAGPCGGTGQEGGNASAGTRWVVSDLGIRVGALEAGDPSFHSSLLGGSASAGEVAGHGFGGLGVGASRRISVGSSVVAASRDGSQHHNAGHSCNGAYENGITHYSFPSVNILMAYVSDISYSVVAIVLHDNVKPIGGFGPAKPKSVNGR